MSSLKKQFFEVAYNWFFENRAKFHIRLIALEQVSANPAIASFERHVQGFEIMKELHLNISPKSCRIEISEEGLWFSGAFAGRKQEDFFTWDKIAAIYDPVPGGEFIGLPYGFGGDPTNAAPATTPVAVPAKKHNPFTVVDGGKE